MRPVPSAASTASSAPSAASDRRRTPSLTRRPSLLDTMRTNVSSSVVDLRRRLKKKHSRGGRSLDEEYALFKTFLHSESSLRLLDFAHYHFKLMDKNGDAFVDLEEFSSSLGVLGSSDAQLGEILFAIFQPDGGVISFFDFFNTMRVLVDGSIDDKLRLAFDITDGNKDGLLQKEELQRVIASLQDVLQICGIGVQEVTLYVDSIFDALDANGDGVISFQEFKDGLLQAKHRQLFLPLGFHDVGLHVPRMRKGQLVAMGHPQWLFTMDIMLGIRLSVKDAVAWSFTDHAPTEDDFTATTRHVLPTGTRRVFSSYAPGVFSRIRRDDGLSEPDFLGSLGFEQLVAGLLLGNLGTLTTFESEGKSGSFFFFSKDGRFLVKTVSYPEALRLFDMLPQYYEHLSKSPHSLLTRYYGLYEVTNGVLGGKTRFVVMKNMFHGVKVDEIYDLKGSTVGRTSMSNSGKRKKGPLKDLDFHRKLSMTPERRAQFLDAVAADSDLLCRLGVVDYSLLLGIAAGDHDGDSAPWARAADGSESYYLGIIDMLVPFDVRKRIEHEGKAMVYDRHGISVIPPPKYAERFRRFMGEIVG